MKSLSIGNLMLRNFAWLELNLVFCAEHFIELPRPHRLMSFQNFVDSSPPLSIQYTLQVYLILGAFRCTSDIDSHGFHMFTDFVFLKYSL